jgi:hypothetical protein
MTRERDDLLDHLLGELDPERAREVRARIARDPELAAQRDAYAEALELLREAARAGWEAPAARRRMRLLRPVLAAAAVLLVAAGLLWLGGGVPRDAVYEPDEAYGYLLAEETDSAGRVPVPSTTGEPRVAAGTVDVAPLGSPEAHALGRGATFAFDTSIRARAGGAARVDLPRGGILFLDDGAHVALRRHQDGGTAMRVLDGTAAIVAGRAMVHVAVEGTDLILAVRDGAALLRATPAEAICLRGELRLVLGGGARFTVPPGRRLPAACAREPETAPATPRDLDLDWYRELVYGGGAWTEVAWEEPGRSAPIVADRGTLLYVEIEPAESGRLEVAFGAEPRVFALRAGRTFRLRLPLHDLGPGDRLTIDPAPTIARVFRMR